MTGKTRHKPKRFQESPGSHRSGDRRCFAPHMSGALGKPHRATRAPPPSSPVRPGGSWHRKQVRPRRQRKKRTPWGEALQGSQQSATHPPAPLPVPRCPERGAPSNHRRVEERARRQQQESPHRRQERRRLQPPYATGPHPKKTLLPMGKHGHYKPLMALAMESHRLWIRPLNATMATIAMTTSTPTRMAYSVVP